MLFGPSELPLRGPAALSQRGDSIEAILDDDGRPRIVSYAVKSIPLSASPVREAWGGGAGAGLALPCAIASSFVFCPDRTGAVHRAPRDGGEGDRVVASARKGTRIAAAVLGGSHTALSYLASRTTSEGWVSEAWIAVDDDPPRRLSEDGSGATAVTLAPRGPSLLALTIDARAALTAMHARPITYEGSARFGEDVVVFVGGPGDRRTAAALALPATGPGWGLLPISKDVREFGLALVRLDDPPRVDEPTAWSLYPNGLDPAPVAASAGARTWVARVRPETPAPTAPGVLELGELGPDASFSPRTLVATMGTPKDAALVVDTRGAPWVSWVDGSGSWIERLACK